MFQHLFFRCFLLFFLLPAMFACGQRSFEEMANDMAGDVPLIYADSLEKSMANYIVFDSREKEEFDVSHIPGARYIGYDHFEVKEVSDIPTDTHIVVYCSVGYRSGRVVEKLKKAGYTNVENLWGGIFNWINTGHPVENEKGITDKVHPYSEKWGKWLTAGVKAYE